jgi:hypothetical protein
MRKYIFILFLFCSLLTFGQYSEEIINTDSSDIKIVRNSMYKIWEEAYRDKDSVWYSVKYINDTSQVNTEGWQTRDGKQLGIWKEYTINGDLMYTWNHETGICEINPKLYPYHNLLEKMKSKADSIIINTYSIDFL